MNFPIHWMALEGEISQRQTKSPTIKSDDLFSLEGFCFGKWSRDILKSSAAVISSAALYRNQRVTKHRWVEYIYISWDCSWTSEPFLQNYWFLKKKKFFFTIFVQAFDWTRIGAIVTVKLGYAGGKNQIRSLTLLCSVQTVSDYFVILWIYFWLFT